MRSTRFRALARALALIAALPVLACGKAARTDGSGSETHWVQSCQADIDCASLGDHIACHNGFCATDVEVASSGDPASSVAMNPAGGSASQTDGQAAAGGADSLADPNADAADPLADDADPFAGLSDAQLAAELCDGSERARLIYRNSLGYSEEDRYWFGTDYGPSHYIVDGQCRLWAALSDSGTLFTRQLDEGHAARLARGVRFGRQAPWSEGAGAACTNTNEIVLWTPQGRVDCRCNCYEGENAPGWNETFMLLALEPLGGSIGLFQDVEPVRGPARVLLYRSGPPRPEDDSGAPPWPLVRPPAESELTQREDFGSWGENWGVVLTDPQELESLRDVRRLANSLDVRYTSLLWTNGDVTEELHMRLLDELPSELAADVRRDLGE